ncbi:hypothetical protein [Inquilinus sp. CA228]|uniref:hypothetical protein n=1 Tax=Inquilinus sp. CA228 TaxID=3455609 RepID=UPI003F8D8B9D
MSGDTEKRFRQALEHLRLAILMTPDLTDRERRLALLMVERTHRKTWTEAELFESWLSVATLGSVTGYDLRTVKRIRQALVQKGVIYVAAGGGQGPHSTTVYGFNGDWINGTWLKLMETGRLGAWDRKRYGDGQSTRVAPATTLSDDDVPGQSDAKSGSGDHREVAPAAILKDGSGDHPNPLSHNPSNGPIPSSLRSDGRPALCLAVDVPSSLGSSGRQDECFSCQHDDVPEVTVLARWLNAELAAGIDIDAVGAASGLDRASVRAVAAGKARLSEIDERRLVDAVLAVREAI